MCRARTPSLPACQATRSSRSLCASATSQSFSLRAACSGRPVTTRRGVPCAALSMSTTDAPCAGPMKRMRCRVPRSGIVAPSASGTGAGHAAQTLAHPVDVRLEKPVGLLDAAPGGNRHHHRPARLAHPQRQSPRARVLPHLDRHADALDLERDGPRPLLAVRLHCADPSHEKSRAQCATHVRRTLHEAARNPGLANNCGGYSPDDGGACAHVALRRQARARRLTIGGASHSAAKLKASPSSSCGRRPRRGIVAMCSSCAMVRSDAAQGSCARMNLAMRGAISVRKREPLKTP